MWRAYGVFLVGLPSAQSDPSKGEFEDMRRGIELLREQNNPVFDGLVKIALAEAEALAGGMDLAITILDDALATAERIGHHSYDAELHRVRGEILLKRDPTISGSAEQALRRAIAVARQQGTRSFELRAAVSLAKLYRTAGRHTDAHSSLAAALEGFLPATEMPEIAEAEALFATLSETKEVVVAETQRQRLLYLRTAYGNALIAARGYGASETTAAFARARESAFDKGAPERLATDYGLRVGSFIRGEALPMRAHTETFLRDVEAMPNSPEAGVAHRAAGLTHWFAGEYAEARMHLERALTLFQPGRDDDLAFRFGNDAGVAAMFYLALTLWPLGYFARAVSLVEEARARSAGLAHIASRAHGQVHVALFELMNGNPLRAASTAAELSILTREHDLPLWRAFGVFFDALAITQSDATDGGLAAMRHGVELVSEQNVIIFDGLIKIELAQAEARAGDVDRALAILGEALATCDQTDHRAFEAELHRVRGDTLLRLDPASSAAAQEALQTAITVAQQQKARSFRLRAALSLAKLYQSTDRLTEAHAVLTPALEGFSATPEMPEIAEAQALLDDLA